MHSRVFYVYVQYSRLYSLAIVSITGLKKIDNEKSGRHIFAQKQMEFVTVVKKNLVAKYSGDSNYRFVNGAISEYVVNNLI